MKTSKIIMAVMALFVISILSLSVFAYRGNPLEKGPNYNEEVHQQLQAALEAKDYEAWIKIREENNLPMKGRIFQVINADNFDKFVELHNAMLSGDTETANRIRAELGLGQGQMKRGAGFGSANNGQGSVKYGQRAMGNCDGSGLRVSRGRN